MIAPREADWRHHPRYLADAGGLFGVAPSLVCCHCKKNDYELFFGHCRACATQKNIPQKVAEPKRFGEALQRGFSVVAEIEVIPKSLCQRFWDGLTSIGKGMASLSLFPRKRPLSYKKIFGTDKDRLASDWQKVGDDLRGAAQGFEQERTTPKS